MSALAQRSAPSVETLSPLWLHRFAVLTAGATFLLIVVGGLVTSTGSGLAVPDWPLSYGGLFPPMVGGILYEHGHRMVATFVGLLTTVLAIWLLIKEPRRWVLLARTRGACGGVRSGHPRRDHGPPSVAYPDLSGSRLSGADLLLSDDQPGAFHIAGMADAPTGGPPGRDPFISGLVRCDDGRHLCAVDPRGRDASHWGGTRHPRLSVGLRSHRAAVVGPAVRSKRSLLRIRGGPFGKRS